MNYIETLDFLFTSLPVFQHEGASAYKPGLENTEKLLAALDDPHKKFLTIHVAGTNGKGSTSHILASVLQSAGYRTGLYTSPHLHDFRERIKVDSQMIPQSEVVDFVENNRKIIGDLSFFELTVGMAFDYFARCGVEIAVIETGLGGRLDSTNVITPLISVITNIGFDHMNLLGNTLEKIAFEKAGIIKENIPAVIGECNELTAPVFMERAAQIGAPIRFAEHIYRCTESTHTVDCQSFHVERLTDGTVLDIELDLHGEYQRKNIVTALAAIDALNTLNITAKNVSEGFRHAARNTGLHGRWEVISNRPLTVCDTGHNEHGLRLVMDQVRRQQFNKLYIILGVVSDKDLNSILPLMPTDAHYIFSRASVARALPAETLQQQAALYGLKGEIVATIELAYNKAQTLAQPEDMIFIGGSTFTVADLKQIG